MRQNVVHILVEPDFVPAEFSIVMDTLRIANRIANQTLFEPVILSASMHGVIVGMGGVMVYALPFQTGFLRTPDHLVVLGGFGATVVLRSVLPRIRRYERSGCHVLLLSDAAKVWRTKMMVTDLATIHWEDGQTTSDEFQEVQASLPLFRRENRITTSAGMASTADVVLRTIVAQVSARLAQRVAQVTLIESIRDETCVQPANEGEISALRLIGLDSVIEAMHDNLEVPLSARNLSEIAGVSVRHLEQQFKKAFGIGPCQYYRRLRLQRSKKILENTNMTVTEIAICFGFSAGGYSKMFAREFGSTPYAYRKSSCRRTKSKYSRRTGPMQLVLA
ncbi:MAG: GlxA family transcriptional regulator [Paracoccaceae bacterium]